MNSLTYSGLPSTKPIHGAPRSPRQKYYDQPLFYSPTGSYSFYGILDARVIRSTRTEFERLARQWKEDTELKSNVTLKAMHSAYQQIIGMGEKAIPLILGEFQAGKYDDWFFALYAIAGDKAPSTTKEAGSIRAMAEVWLTWGRSKGYL